jgi:hypothetical protein
MFHCSIARSVRPSNALTAAKRDDLFRASRCSFFLEFFVRQVDSGTP